MSAEHSLLDMLGYGKPELVFLGQTFTLRPDGLLPLLRYSLDGRPVPGHDRTDRETEQITLAGCHRILETCVEDFPALERLALEHKAQPKDITDAVARVTSFYCGRSHWAAMRLMAFLAANLEEIDGKLIQACGRGVAGLSAREACNLALAICLEGRDEEDRAIFLDDLNFEGNPEAEALAMVREMQAARKAAQEAAEAAGGG